MAPTEQKVSPQDGGGDEQDSHQAKDRDASNSDQGDLSAGGKKGKWKGWRFWLIILSLCFTIMLVAIESTVVSTALPSIAGDLEAGQQYVWFGNSFFLTAAAFQPLFGQTANLFGRRWLTIFAVSVFILGSGIAGGATSSAMLIGGRTVQGIGYGGITLMVDMVIADICPLRERAKYLGIVFAFFSIGSSLGPVVGGLITDRSSWRWVFWLSLPIGGVSLAALFAFLHVNYRKERWQDKLKRIDYLGNAILMTSAVSVMIALSWGGSLYPWSNWRIVLSLVLGLGGMIAFFFYEASPWCKEPTMPLHLFANRTSAAAMAISFFQSMLMYWVIYFLPLYFQSVQLSSPTRSGVQFLPTVVLAVPCATAGGILLTVTGRYRPIHFFAAGISLLGLGLFSRLDRNSSAAEWIIYQILYAIGSGLLLTTTLPAVQAELSEADVGLSTSTWAFIRSYGAIWGISIPVAVFNSRFDSLSGRISDLSVRAMFQGGAAYSLVSSEDINSLPAAVIDEVVSVYTDSQKLAWYVSLAFAALGFFAVFLEKEIKLDTVHDTEYGIKERERDDLEKRVEEQ